MYLSQALGVTSAAELDPTRVLTLGPFELGIEATAEAIRLLAGGDFQREVNVLPRPHTRPIYWLVAHRTAGGAEVFGFPASVTSGLPTAIEIALVRAVAAAPPEDHAIILAGNAEITLGPSHASSHFRKVIEIVDRPTAGASLLFEGANQANIDENITTLLNKVALNCLANSFRASPIKFRLLELYRMMEARFLADVKAKLLASFDAGPSVALSEAADALKSEVLQLTNLAETHQNAFEACWTVLDQMRNTNQFTAALFRTVKKKGLSEGGKWKAGVALVYQIRCAIDHAGGKDIIFESFPDGENAIEIVLPYVERAALLLVGIELS